MDIRLLELEYFATVCEKLNFTKAAEQLNISQPSLSQKIRFLEHEFGAELFLRSGKKVYITPSGEILLRHARRIFSEINLAQSMIKELKDARTGKITIGYMGNYVPHTAISSFHQRFPNVNIRLIEVSIQEINTNLLNHQFDLGIICMPPIKEPYLEYKFLTIDKGVLVVSATHKFAKKTSVKLKDLKPLTLYLIPRYYYSDKFINTLFIEAGVTLKPAIELSDRHALLQLVVQNDGATIMPVAYMRDVNDPRLRQIPIEDSLPTEELALIYKKNTVMPPMLETFIDTLVQHFTYSV